MTPFDFAKSIISSKDNLYSTEALFQKEYVSFMVNRILSNSSKAALFADVINRYPNLDKKLQYDFYLRGLPKGGSSSKLWSKKEGDEDRLERATIVAKSLNVSLVRAEEYLAVIDDSAFEEHKTKFGGKQ